MEIGDTKMGNITVDGTKLANALEKVLDLHSDLTSKLVLFPLTDLLKTHEAAECSCVERTEDAVKFEVTLRRKPE